MLILLVYIVLLLIPTFALVFWVSLVTKRERAKSAVPFTELQRRPAGESTRLKMEKYSDDLDIWLMAIVFVPIAFALILFVSHCKSTMPGWRNWQTRQT
jgi:hypothetical protein